MNFEDFKRLVVGLFARYPSASLSDATVPAWWAELRGYSREVLIEAFRRAPRGHAQFCPSCETVREHAEAAAKVLNAPRADLSRLALPEAEPELPPELAEIREAQKAGDLSPGDASKAYLRWVMEQLP